MSVRIYALAKQLRVESKLLVDLCKQLKLEGKGSALASLTDEEVVLIKAELQKENFSAKTAKEAVENAGAVQTPVERPSIFIQTGKVPVLKPQRPARSASDLVSETSAGTPSKIEPVSDVVPPLKKETEPESSEQSAERSVFIEPDVQQTEPQTASNPASPIETTDILKEEKPSIDLQKIPSIDTQKVPSINLQKIPSLNTQKVPSLIPERKATVVEKTPSETEADQLTGQTDKTSLSQTVSESGKQESAEQQSPSQTINEDRKSELPQEPAVEKTPDLAKEEILSGAEVKQETGSSVISAVADQTETPSAPSDQEISPKPEPSVQVTKKPPVSLKQEPEVDISDKKSSKEDEAANKAQSAGPLSHLRKTVPSPASKKPAAPPAETVSGVSALKTMEEAASKAPLNNFRSRPLSSVSSDNRIKDLNRLTSKKPKNTGDNDTRPHRQDNRPAVSVRLVQLPNAPQPKAAKQTREPAPQKPSARFTSIEELKAAAAMEKSGISPLSGHMANRKGKNAVKSKKETPAPAAGKQERVFPEKEDTRIDKGGKKIIEPRNLDDDFGSAKGVKKARRQDSDRSSRRRGGSLNFFDEDSFEDRSVSKQHRLAKNKAVVSTVPRKGDCVIEMPCTVKQFAETTGVSVAAIIKKLMEFGLLATINQPLELETIELLIEAFELKAVVKKERSLEELFVDSAFDQTDPPESLKLRPPVVTFLGHVDHGKTSLLDRIMHMNVVSSEKGGITQHIRTYRISTKNGDVTFVDTPGHEAFTEMRARGANCTDIAVLVVAADDGVMPQTEEAISHIKAANVPIVVALNKMDLPGVTREKAIQELAGNDLMPSEWGGDVEIVETSATTGMGIDKLMDTLLMIAELRELKANPNRPATGVSLESSMEPGQGVVCKILVQNGTLRPGDIVLCGTAYGKVKAMTDPLHPQKHLKSAGPSTPVTLLGLNTPPGAGSKFVVLEDISVARQIAEQREKIVHERELSGGEEHVTLESLFDRINSAKTQQTLNVIIRADVRGSIEAIRKELSKLEHPEVKVKILQASVGGITEADVHLADASDAIIVGFNVVPDENARSLAEKKKIQIRRYDIIYKLTEDIRAALEGMLKPIEQVKEMGAAVVQQTFTISRIGTIAGCRVIRGVIDRECHCRVIRDHRIIGDYVIDTLRREKDDAKEVRDGYECGIKLKNFNDVKQGDTLEAYKIEEIARKF